MAAGTVYVPTGKREHERDEANAQEIREALQDHPKQNLVRSLIREAARSMSARFINRYIGALETELGFPVRWGAVKLLDGEEDQ